MTFKLPLKIAASVLTAAMVLTACATSSDTAGKLDATDSMDIKSDMRAMDWGYEGGTGAAFWGDLSEEFATCKTGKAQSPIDFAQVRRYGQRSVSTNYGTASAEVKDSGHGIKVSFEPGQTMISEDMTFNLLQFHFHTPSEHVVSGAPYPLVVHLVHASNSGDLGVLGVFFEQGDANAALEEILDNVGDNIAIDSSDLLPSDLTVYKYQGSLTTPPCSEGVNWHVAKSVITASADQITRFNALQGMNARPVQPINDRVVIGPLPE